MIYGVDVSTYQVPGMIPPSIGFGIARATYGTSSFFACPFSCANFSAFNTNHTAEYTLHTIVAARIMNCLFTLC
jgi:hypothetical protein